jgi:hypothetical protein
VLDFNYGFAANGNIMAIVNNRENTRSQAFAYDQGACRRFLS